MFLISLNYQGHVRIEMCSMLDVNIKVITSEIRMPTLSNVNVSAAEYTDDTILTTRVKKT